MEWRLLTGRMPADWFAPESWPLLVQLCRHICQSRFFGQCLQEVRAGCLGTLDEDTLERMGDLARMHIAEGRAIQALMVKLRLTTQARMPNTALVEQARADNPDVRPWQN